MFVLRVSDNNVTILFFCLRLINCPDLKERSIEDHIFFFGFVEDLWFDDVIYGFWVYDWVFSKVC